MQYLKFLFLGVHMFGNQMVWVFPEADVHDGTHL